jgi:hypothetical protein
MIPAYSDRLMNAADARVRELDFRESVGLQVTLLWQEVGNRIWVRVRDARTDDVFAFGVDPADALDAFHHPFAYAPQYGLDGWGALALES